MAGYPCEMDKISKLCKDKKIEIMSLYESEIGKEPFPRSEQNIRSLAKFRGSTAGVLSAEAFILLKEII